MSDSSMASIGRDLARAFIRFARERADQDKKLVAQLSTDLCNEYRSEQHEATKAETTTDQ